MKRLPPNSVFICLQDDKSFIKGEKYHTNQEGIIVDEDGDERPVISYEDVYFFDRFIKL